jgi:hypothetical protein
MSASQFLENQQSSANQKQKCRQYGKSDQYQVNVKRHVTHEWSAHRQICQSIVLLLEDHCLSQKRISSRKGGRLQQLAQTLVRFPAKQRTILYYITIGWHKRLHERMLL